jgi:hypothetical protein
MGTIVTYPRERHAEGRQLTRAELTDEEGRTIRARIIIENVRNWIDSDENKIESMGMPRAEEPKLTPEQIEERAAAGEGTFGHTTIFEPADLDLYCSFMYPPLTMPAKPQVMISYWDMNNKGPQHFMEGRVMVKAMCPDGIESWLVISVPVPNFHTCLEGNCWGWPKYVADEMTVEKDHSEVIYEGKPSLTLDFTAHDFDEATIQQLKDNGSEGGNTVSFHMSTGGVGQPTLMRQGTGPRKGGDNSHYAEWEAGMIKIWGRLEDKWSSLLPENCVVPGVWMRRVPTGGGRGGGMYKVTTTPAK